MYLAHDTYTHIVLFTVRQYEGKFVQWLVEAYYLRMFLQLSHVPHYITFQFEVTNT
jgi:hypothetical protein